MKLWIYAWTAVAALTAAWCLAGLLGWGSVGDRVTDAVCLPFNVLWVRWGVALIRRLRKSEARR